MNIICMCMPIHLFQITIDTILLLCVLRSIYSWITNNNPAALNFTLLSFYSLNNHEKIFIIDMYVKANNNLQHEKFIS